jgi:hypothetical protein
MHVDVSWILWTFGMFYLCFVEIRLWLVVKGRRRPCEKQLENLYSRGTKVIEINFKKQKETILACMTAF